MTRTVHVLLTWVILLPALAQQASGVLPKEVQEQLLASGFLQDDLRDLVLQDALRSEDSGIEHLYLRQRWQGIGVWNGDIAIHSKDGSIIAVHNGAWSNLALRVNTTTPKLRADDALAIVLARNLPGTEVPALIASEDSDRRSLYDGTGYSGEPASVQLYYLAVHDSLRLVWNVNHYTPDGVHWWNVRIDAVTGQELERNDWVSDCGFDHMHSTDHTLVPEEEMPMPAAPNDLRVYAYPTESPGHGARTLQNAPWTQGGVASPFGWNDTNGANGAEYTVTRGNNVWAKEDIANDNETTAGYNPNGGVNLDFDFPINLAGAPNTYQDALITNLYYWNNLVHDVWYGYGFNEVSGNFQQNNYGRGGTGNDYVLADALDGSGTNNANFATPAEGTRPRMQMYTWTYTTPSRDSDLDNGVIAHEYGHGISNRLVGGPANVNCLTNAEQMGEGWSDFIGLVMTMKAGDTGPMPRGIGTYVTGQPATGGGIRPAPYSTDLAVNNFTYAATNNAAITQPHGVGFVWCTMLWEMTWELIGVYGWDPNLYTGTGGNNKAMRLVIEGMKLTPCSPGFVGARDAILLADQNIYGGANQATIWNAFARRGLGSTASQGSSASRSDQTEAYNTPYTPNVSIASITEPLSGQLYACASAPVTVRAVLRNHSSNAMSNIPLRYRSDGGAWVTQTFTGPLASGASVTVSFTTPVLFSGLGAHTLDVSTALVGDLYPGDNAKTNLLTVVAATTVTAPYSEGLSAATPTPAGWSLRNPDNATTWSTSLPAIGPGPTCVSSRTWSIDNFNYNGAGQEDRLVSPLVNLIGLMATRLKFDHAYARYSVTLSDGFRVEISPNCGGNWTTLLAQSGTALATAPDNTAVYTPANCTQWRANNLDISAYDGLTVLVRFVAINGYGNTLYLDNVSFTGDPSTLPVELLRFTGADAPGGVLLEWSTASEQNTDRFEVERSADLDAWSTIGTRPAQGFATTTTQYDLLDERPFEGTAYYRLHMLDMDGSASYSEVVAVKHTSGGQQCYPNPNDGAFRVLRPTAGTPIAITDALGRQVAFRLETITDGSAVVQLATASPGVYLVTIGGGQDQVMERVVISGH